MSIEYVELNRTFLDFSSHGEKSDPETLRMIAEMSGKKTDWEVLVQSPYVVVLGEAGSGKTREFQERTRILSESGKHAFFCRIEDLANEGLQQALPMPDDVEKFQAWIKSGDASIFFLDSVDEARLRGYRLDRPLRKLVRALGRAMDRARLVISCRVSDWRAEADIEAIEAILPSIDDAKINGTNEGPDRLTPEELKKHIRVVQLAPLNRDQIAKFAFALGITDIDAFLNEIGDADVWHFVERPKDVDWLAEYWKVKGRFGTLTELMKHNIDKKLQETNIDRRKFDPISAEDAIFGVKMLAAASTFCKKTSFLIPDEQIDPDRALTAIDPKDVLLDWPSEKIDALLTRAIFDEATYGRVRFHHRSVTEYLTAQWFKDRLDEGCPRPNIERLLFKEKYGRSFAVPSLAPMTAWLSWWDDIIRQRAIKVTPEIFMQYGDPQAIPLEQRVRLLRQYVQQYSERQWTGHTFDWATLKRFAHKDLSHTINELLGIYQTETDIRILLLRLVESSKLSACTETILPISLDDKERQDVRLYAIRALGAAGTEHELLQLAEYARSKAEELPNRLLGVLCETLFPRVFNIDDLLLFIECARPEKHSSSLRRLTYALEHIFKHTCPKDRLLELLKRLIELVQKPPFLNHNGNVEINAQFSRLVELISKLLTRILKEFPSDHILSNTVLSTLEFLQKCRTIGLVDWHSKFDEVSRAISKHPALHRALFWKHVDKIRTKGDKEVIYAWQLTCDSLWEINADDFDWLLEDLSTKRDIEDRLLSLDGALTSLGDPEGKQDKLQRLISAIGDEPVLKEHLNSAINPPPRKETEKGRKWRKEREAREREKNKRFRERCEYLQREIESIRTGTNFNALIYLYDFMSEQSAENRLGLSNWHALIPKFGEEVAKAAREGFKKYWPKWKPPLPHEKTKRNTIENELLVGLTGLALTVEDGFDFRELSPKEAQYAARYATRELNDFPHWLSKLAEVNPEIVRKTFSLTLTEDFSVRADESHHHGVLSSLPYAPPTVRNLCTPGLMKLLRERDPEQIETLQEILRILIVEENTIRQELITLATQRTPTNKNDLPRLLAWLSVWFYIGAESALNFLENHLKDLTQKTADDFVLELCGTLRKNSENRFYQTKPDYLRVSVLKQMIPIVYTHVRPESDIFQEGVYSPRTRDHAERFRDQLVHNLANTPGESAYRVLLDLAENPCLIRSRELLLILAQEKAARDAEYEAWAPKDVVVFANKFESDPKTANDLFNIAINRLEQLRSDIETSDYSERDLFTHKTDETVIQKWVANRLLQLARGRYSVVREEEVDKLKKPDIRLHHPAVSASVGIEVKCANKLSYNDLKAALSEQLVGQYLRDIRSRHGILLLANLGDKKWDPRDKSGRLKFPALVKRLDGESKRIAEANEDLVALRVFGIDFTP